MAKAKDNPLVPWQNNLTGRCIQSVDSAKIEFVSEDQQTIQSDNFSSLKNIKYTDNGVTGVTNGMTKINSTALTSHPLIRSAYHFKKVQPAETHVLVQADNSGGTESKVFQNTTAIPSAGDFSSTALHTDAAGSNTGRWSGAPDEHIAYCNSGETMVWGGDETRVSNFTIFDPNGTFLYDYTVEVQNTLTDTANVATLKQVQGIGSETKLLLHCNGSDESTTITDDSPTTPHTVTAVGNTQIDTAAKHFGTAALLMDGTSDWATIPDNADFDFSGGLMTFEGRIRVASLSADVGLYSQAITGRTGDYMWIYIDTNGAVKLKIQEGTTAATGTVTLDSGATGSVDSVTVNGVTVTSGVEAFDTDLDTTATNIAANITAHTSSPNYTASAASSVITITSDDKGDHVNTYAVVSNTTTIASTDVNMASGANTTVVDLSTPDSTITTSSSTFTHIRVVENSNDYYIFVGGVQKAFLTDSSRTEGNGSYDSLVYIGATHDGTSTTKSFNGSMDELRLTDSALSTSNFDLPASAYTSATANVNMRIGNTLPVDGFKFSVSNANTTTGTMAVFYWSSVGEWTAVTNLTDNTASGGIPLAQDGTVTFDSTANIAKPSVIDGVFGFWFKIEITNTDVATAISHVTISEPFQALQDFWDGDFRTANSIQLFEDNINKDNTINVLKDEFIFNEITQGNTATYMAMDNLTASSEFLQVGFSERQQGLRVKMIPGHGNIDVPATGSVVIGDNVEINDNVSSIKVNNVEIMSGTVTAASTDEPSFAQRIVDNINNHTSTPNYTAETDINQNITITAETRGSGSNGFTVSGTSASMTLTTVDMANGRDVNAVLTINYWNGTAWVSVGDIQDGTISDNSSFGVSGFITWNAVAENTEFKRELAEEIPAYHYKLEWNDQFSDDALCYYIAGIPVQRRISNFRFPLYAQNRLWLFSDQAENKNLAIVSNLNELNTFNGVGVGDPLSFGDKSETVAAVEIFERTSARVKSHILVLKENSSHVIEGDNPEDWSIVNLTDNIGCNAPHTLQQSTLGLEFSPLQRKQIAIWQGSSGIYMFDNSAIHPVSDDISNFFDQRNSNAINLSKAHLSTGFFEVENGEHYYHWCFASGSSTTLNEEWVLDIKRQTWFEYDRGTGKALQGGVSVVDTTGNIYTYGFENGGYLQRLNNGTDFDGNAIGYEMAFGDVLPAASINILTRLDSIRMAVVSKTTTSNSILVYHYGDTKTAATNDNVAGTAFYTLSTIKTGQRLAFPFKRINSPKHMTHKLKFTMSTDDETVGFEPLYIGGFYKLGGNSERNITD